MRRHRKSVPVRFSSILQVESLRFSTCFYLPFILLSMLHSIRQFIEALQDPYGLTRTLGEIEVCRSSDGDPLRWVGNSAVVFKIRCGSRYKMLKCYTRPMEHLEAIYQEKLLRQELYVWQADGQGEWCDVVVDDWIEGITLYESVMRSADSGDKAHLSNLARQFDRLALELLESDWAHGDLKPENILLDESGTLRPVDFDAMFLPVFAGEKSPELGTAAYQHPGRTAEDFDASIDDYSIATISTTLHALALEPGLLARYNRGEGTMQLLIGAGLAGVAFTIPTTFFFQASLAVFWLLAFSSATHDIAADGFYMLALDSHEQAFFVGIRSTFYRIAIIAGQGVLVMFAGFLENSTGNIPLAWSVTFFILGGLFLALFLYHRYILPLPKGDKPSATVTPSTILKEFFATFASFFKKKQAFVAILFMLLYRFPEAQLAKLVTPFLVDPREVGGLGLSTAEIGLVYGTIGTIGLTLGGILGGIAASAGGLKKWIWPMALAISLPDAVFIYLSSALPDNLWIVNICVFIEQFGYGFGFTAYMLYLIYYSDGEHKTAHYAICTAFMALGLMLPGMAAGWLQEQMGYENFF